MTFVYFYILILFPNFKILIIWKKKSKRTVLLKQIKNLLKNTEENLVQISVVTEFNLDEICHENDPRKRNESTSSDDSSYENQSIGTLTNSEYYSESSTENDYESDTQSIVTETNINEVKKRRINSQSNNDNDENSSQKRNECQSINFHDSMSSVKNRSKNKINHKESSSSFEMDEIELHRNLTKTKENQLKVISKSKPSYDEEEELKL